MQINETVIENELKNDGRNYELQLAPLKRLLLKGSKLSMAEGTEKALTEAEALGTKHKISGAALLEFRKQVENYALQLAAELGANARNDVRVTIKHKDVIKAVTPQVTAAPEP